MRSCDVLGGIQMNSFCDTLCCTRVAYQRREDFGGRGAYAAETGGSMQWSTASIAAGVCKKYSLVIEDECMTVCLSRVEVQQHQEAVTHVNDRPGVILFVVPFISLAEVRWQWKLHLFTNDIS